MIVSPMNQVFYPQEANRLYGHCTCTDKSGDCDWCFTYYCGDFVVGDLVNETENAWIEYAKSIRAGMC